MSLIKIVVLCKVYFSSESNSLCLHHEKCRIDVKQNEKKKMLLIVQSFSFLNQRKNKARVGIVEQLTRVSDQDLF